MNLTFDVVPIGGMLAILGYMIKRWVNGTAREINDLKKAKQDITFCAFVHGANTKTIENIEKQIEHLINLNMEDRIKEKEDHKHRDGS